MSSITINIFYVKVNSVENASAFNIGQSLQADWNNSDKRTQGYGQNYGDESEFVGMRNYIDDSDLIDTPSEKISLPPAALKSYFKEDE